MPQPHQKRRPQNPRQQRQNKAQQREAQVRAEQMAAEPSAALLGTADDAIEDGFGDDGMIAELAPVAPPAATSARPPARRDDRRARTSRRPAAQPVAPTITRAQEYDFIRVDLRRLLITAAVVLVLMLALLFVIEG